MNVAYVPRICHDNVPFLDLPNGFLDDDLARRVNPVSYVIINLETQLVLRLAATKGWRGKNDCINIRTIHTRH